MTLIIVFSNIIVTEKKIDKLSFRSKHSFLNEFFDDLDKLNYLNPQQESTKVKKISVDAKASELYKTFLGIYYHEYHELSEDKKKKIDSKYDPKDSFLDGCD